MFKSMRPYNNFPKEITKLELTERQKEQQFGKIP